MNIRERYAANLGAFSQQEVDRVHNKSACVVGCGGLGGYVCNNLARFGVGKLTVIDGDSFSTGNLNRQLFAERQTLGQNKALACQSALLQINEDVIVSAHPVMLSEDNALSLLSGSDVVVDCLDNIPARKLLAKACEKLGIPLIHGAISGLFGQVACIMPGDRLFEHLYPSDMEKLPDGFGNPVFSPVMIASVQSCEAVKILSGREPGLKKQLLYIDLVNYDFETVSFQ